MPTASRAVAQISECLTGWRELNAQEIQQLKRGSHLQLRRKQSEDPLGLPVCQFGVKHGETTWNSPTLARIQPQLGTSVFEMLILGMLQMAASYFLGNDKILNVSDGDLEMIPVKEPPIEVRMEVKLLTTGEPSSWVL